MHHASLVIHSSYQCSTNLEKAADLSLGVLMAIPPTDIRIIFTNYMYDIIRYFFNLASCSEHFISIKHRIFGTININKKFNSDSLYAFKALVDI